MEYKRRNNIINAIQWDGTQETLRQMVQTFGTRAKFTISLTFIKSKYEANQTKLTVTAEQPGFKETIGVNIGDYIFRNEEDILNVWDEEKFNDNFNTDDEPIDKSYLLLISQNESNYTYATNIYVKRTSFINRYTGGEEERWAVCNSHTQVGLYTTQEKAKSVAAEIKERMLNLNIKHEKGIEIKDQEYEYHLPKD